MAQGCRRCLSAAPEVFFHQPAWSMRRETSGLREGCLAAGPKSVCELKKSDSTSTVDKHLRNLCFSNAQRQPLPTLDFLPLARRPRKPVQRWCSTGNSWWTKNLEFKTPCLSIFLSISLFRDLSISLSICLYFQLSFGLCSVDCGV